MINSIKEKTLTAHHVHKFKEVRYTLITVTLFSFVIMNLAINQIIKTRGTVSPSNI